MKVVRRWAFACLSSILVTYALYGAEPMPKVYTVGEDETLSQIAQTQLGDTGLWLPLARFNGLKDPNFIRAGQRLLIPQAGELLRADRRTQTQSTIREEIERLRGEIRALREGLAYSGLGLVPIYRTLFEGDALKQTPSGWQFPSGGKWRIAEDGTRVLEQYDRRQENQGAVVGESSWTNYIVQAEVKIKNSGDVGIFAYWRSNRENYRLRTFDRFRKLQLTKREPRDDDGFRTRILAQVPISMRENTWYKVELQIQNMDSYTYLRGRIWKKGTPKPTDWTLEAADYAPGQYTQGKAGVWTYRAGSSYRGAEIDNFTVLAVP